jgi:hypothetical protein
MSRDPNYTDLDEIAENMDKREAVYVDDKGNLITADKLGGTRPERGGERVTQIKDSTWFVYL